MLSCISVSYTKTTDLCCSVLNWFVLVGDAYLEALMQAAILFFPFDFVRMHNCICNLAENQSQAKNEWEKNVSWVEFHVFPVCVTPKS